MAAPEQTKRKLTVTLTDITKNNINQLRVLNKAVLPIEYSDKYYTETASNWPRENPWCKLAYHNEYLVGAINSRRETYNPKLPLLKVAHLAPGDELVKSAARKSKPLVDSHGNQLSYRVCITTLSVLPAYQSAQIGTTLLEDLLKTADEQYLDIDAVYVQVHVNNEKAIAFYKRFGFEEIGVLEDYYKTDKVTPPHAMILSRKTVNREKLARQEADAQIPEF